MNRLHLFATNRRTWITVGVVTLLATGLILQTLPLFAASFTVNSTLDRSDASPGNGICATSSGECTLRAAIQEANASPGADIIQLGSAVYELGIPAINDDTDGTGDFDIRSSITFIGVSAAASIIDGGFPPQNVAEAIGLDRLFEIHPGTVNVTFKDVTLREGYSTSDGAGIQNWSSGVLRLENVHVLKNLAGGSGGGINHDEPSGYVWTSQPAVMPKSGRLEIVNSTFSGNAASTGAAINNAGSGTVSISANSQIVDNPGQMIPNPLEPESLIPAPGVYEPGGGAIANAAEFGAVGTINIADSTIARNYAASDGAGLHNAGDGTILIERTTIDHNTTEAGGGGFYNGGGTVTIRHSTIAHNHAHDGAGIYTSGAINGVGLRSRFTIANSTIEQNEALASGGGMVNGGDSQLTLTDVIFAANKAGDAGAGLENSGGASTDATRVTFTGNIANGEGGGAWIGSTRISTLRDSLFTGNRGGEPDADAIANPGGANIASGGGLYSETGPLTILNSTFEDNRATADGGGIALDNFGDVIIRDTIVRNNHADENGGGIENSGTRVTFERMTVSNNYAGIDGGGIHNSSSGPFTIVDTTIDLNSGSNGGGIGNAPDNALIVRNSFFYRNTARYPVIGPEGVPEDGGRGGGLYSLADGASLVENSTFSGNTAGVGGGGIFHDADGELKLISLTIWRNSAPLGGGVGVAESDFVPTIPPQPSHSVIARNTIIGGSLQGGTCDWYLTTEGGNIDTSNTCFLSIAIPDGHTSEGRDWRAPTFAVDALADNGGHTLSHALREGSIAIDAAVGTCAETDQRGVVRPQNASCDIGAYEYEGDPPAADNVPPDSEYLTGPIQNSLETMAFTFTGSDNVTPADELQFECRLLVFNPAEPPEIIAPWDPVPPELQWQGCSSPWQTLLLEEAQYNFEVRAIDRNGNIDPTPDVHTFSGLDTVPPQTIIAEKPALTTSSRAATFTFTGTDNQTPPQFLEFECRLDTNDPDLWLECVNPALFSNLTTGSHTMEVRAIDTTGNFDPTPARYTWTIGQPSGSVNCDLANISLTAVADAWVNEVVPTENYLFYNELSVSSGAVGAPPVGQNARTLVRFALPNDAPGCTLESATLRLYNSGPTEGRIIEAVPLAGSWLESTVTWFNQPAAAATAPAISEPVHGYQDWDVKSHVLGMIASGVNHGWQIRDSMESDLEAGGDQSYASRELPQDPPEMTLPILVLRYAADTAPPPPPPAPAATATTVHCGQVLTQSTKVANDLTNCPGEGLIIGAPSIVLDLNGHIIDGPDYLATNLGSEEGFPAGIRNSGHTNVVIKNGTVQQFGWGVHLTPGTTRNIIENLTISRNAVAGIELFDADDGRNGNTIRNNYLFDNELGVALLADSQNSQILTNTINGSLGEAILIEFSDGHHIQGNQMSGIPLDPTLGSDMGVLLNGSSHNVFLNNTLQDTGDAGFNVSGGSNHNRFEGNTMYRNGDAGIIVQESHGNQIINNISHQQSDGGVVLSNANDTIVRGNDLRYNPSGVEAGGTHDLILENNNGSESLGAGFELGSGLNMIIRNNVANQSGGSGISLEGGEFDANGNPIGGALIEGNTTNENRENGIVAADGGHTIQDNNAHNNAGFGITVGEMPLPGEPFTGSNIDGGGNRATGNREVAQCVGVVCDESGSVPVSTPDTTPPNVVIIDGPGTMSGTVSNSTSATFVFTGTDNHTAPTGLVFECRLDAPPDPVPTPTPTSQPEPPEPPEPGATPTPPSSLPDPGNWGSCISPQHYNNLQQGDHHFEVRARDQAEPPNVDQTPDRYEWTIDITDGSGGSDPDTTAPTTRITTAPANPSTSTSAAFHFAGSDNLTPGLSLTFECQLDGGGFTACTVPQNYTGLTPGSHTFAVRAKDAALNLDATPALHTWTIVVPPADTTPPNTTIGQVPDAVTIFTSATFSFTSNETGATFECSLDGGATYAACTSPATFTGLAVGARDFRVRAIDGALNVDPTPATFTWTITPAPVNATIFCGQTIMQSIIANNDLLDCPWDGIVVGANNITIDLNGHSIDGVGLAAGIRVDGKAGVTIKNGTVNGFDYGVMLNAGATGTLVETMTLQNNQEAGIALGAAPHQNNVSDPAPAPLPDSYQSGVSGNIVRNNMILANDTGVLITNRASQTVMHNNLLASNNGAGVDLDRANQNTVDTNEISGSSGGAVVLHGSNNNTIRNNIIAESGVGVYIGATIAGVIGQPSNNNIVDGNLISEINGDVLEISGSDGNQLLNNITHGANGSGINLYQANDNIIRGNDVSGNKSGITLVGSSGNRLEANNTSESESVGIAMEALSLNNDLVNNISSFNGSDGIYVGDETTGDQGMVIDGNQTHSNVGYGIYIPKVSHTIKNNIANDNGGWGIWASDGSNGRTNIDGGGNRAQGNIGPLDPVTGNLLQCFAVQCDGGPVVQSDQIAPDTLILQAPTSPNTSNDATFIFNGSDNSGTVAFQCRIDGGSFAPCGSPAQYTLAVGVHTFEVRAVDNSGNVDLTAAMHTWEILPQPAGAPETTITAGPDLTTVNNGATFSFVSSESGSTFECALDGGSFSACTSPKSYGGLAVGPHTFQVRATDTSAETDATPATYSWTIGATPTPSAVNCGDVIVQSIRLLNDLLDCTGHGLIIGANGITIDLNGHVIDGTGIDAGILNNGYDSVTVINGSIHEFDYGVLLNPGASLNVISGLTVENNATAGIALSDADQAGVGNTIRDNTVTANGFGIALYSNTRHALIRGNALGGNLSGGIRLEFSHENRIEANEVATSGGDGISSEGGNNNTIVNNVLTNNLGFGIAAGSDLLASDGNVIESNTVSGGQGGIGISASSANVVRFNTVTGATGPGIALALAQNTLVHGNDLRSNQGGIALDEANNNRLEANNVSGNLGTGIEIGALSYNNIVVQNAVNLNGGTGIEVVDVAPVGSGNLLDRNIANSNTGDGILVSGVGHTLTANSAQINGGWGIYAAAGATDGGGNFAAGNVEPAQCFNIVCTIGTVPGAPDTWIVSAPAATSNSRNASFTYLAEDATTPLNLLVFECRLDSTNPLDWVECEYPAEYLNLSPGTHTFEVRALDTGLLADPTPAQHTWTYAPLPAGVAPTVTIDLAPEPVTMLLDVLFTFHANEPDVALECQVDLLPYAPCGFEGVTYMAQGAFEHSLTEIEVGLHTFAVRATDFEGNVGVPTTYTWSLEGVATTFTAGPGFTPGETPLDPPTGGPVSETTATISFVANVPDATFMCSLDLALFEPCSSPLTYSGLLVGAHELRVFATDPNTGATEVEPAAYEWEIIETQDVNPPDTILGNRPANNSSSTVFEFTGVDAETPPQLLTFECRVDSTNNLDWAACLSPFNLLDLFTYQDPQMAPGQHVFEVRAIDAAEPLDPNAPQEGNVDPSPAAYTWTMTADTTAPGTGIFSGPVITTGLTSAEFTFFGSDNATPLAALTFECALDAEPFAACTSPESVTGLTPGAHTFRVRAIDLAGNVDATPFAYNWTIVAAPVTTITSGPGGQIINGVPPVAPSTLQTAIFIFSANQAGSTFACSFQGAAFTPCVSPRAYTLAADGAYEFAVQATNPQGVVGEPVVYEWQAALGPDIVAPNTTITAQPTNPDTNTVATFSFTGSDNRTPAANLTFECALDGTAYNSCVSPQQFSDLQRGVHTMLIRARDAAGNFDPTPASYTWVVEPPPVSVILSGPAELTESRAATFTFQADVAGSTFQCWLDGLLEACTSPKSYSNLTPGAHLFAVLAAAPAGTSELQWVEYEWIIGDMSAPVTTISSGPGIETSVISATFVFSANEPDATFTCSLNGGAAVACTSPQLYPRLFPGPQSFTVVAASRILTDALGLPVEPLYEPIPVSYEWTVIDAEAPDTLIDYGPALTATNTTAIFGVSTEDPTATIECSLDGGAFSSCDTPVEFTNLAPGSHTLVARATDEAGNVDATPATYTWTIVQLAPNTPVGTNVTINLPLPGGAGTATITFFEVTTLGVTTIDPLNSVPPLPGEYVLAGGIYYDVSTTAQWTEPATLCLPYNTAAFSGAPVRLLHYNGSEWVDVTTTNNITTGIVCGLPESFSPFAIVAGSGLAPIASILTGPSNPSTSGSATFTFVADHLDALFQCSLDGMGFTQCTSPITYTHLESGLHDFQVQAIGADGQFQLLPSFYEWEVILGPDTTAPDTTITRGPSALTANFISIFEFTGSDDQTLPIDLEFECSLDGVVLGSCSSPEEITVLAAGVHTFTVRALDAAGNVDPTPASRTWTVIDFTAPETSIDLGPDSEITATTAVFEFSGIDVVTELPVTAFDCALDSADFAPCTSPYTVTGLLAGPHVFQVRAVDSSGVVDPSPEFYEWLILPGGADTTPPDTFIVAGPPVGNSGPDVIFGFNSNEPVEGFECALDGAPFESCDPAYELIGLISGTHTIQVRAIDIALNVDPTPASYTWMTLGEPDTTILSGPALLSNSISATFVFTTNQAGATFQCSIDGTAFTTCTSPYLAGPLTEETHQFEVRAVNQFVTLEGEQVVDMTPATYEWEVLDATPPDTTIISVTLLGPLDLIEPNSLRFQFAGTDNRTAAFDLGFECALDGGPWEGCEALYYLPLEGLTGGVHTLQVRAVDELENADPTPASYSFSTDGKPETLILSGPPAQTESITATFIFTSSQPGPGGTPTFECSLDLTPYVACASPLNLTNVPYGAHQLLVRGIAADGTVETTPAEYTWESGDLTPPVVTILTGPPITTTVITATFTFTSDDPAALFQCSLDGGALTFCTSGVTYGGLLAGEHTLEVVATKPNLLVEALPAEWIWTVEDLVAPETTIVSGPAAAIALGAPAAFTFSSNEVDASFECALNGAAFSQCATPPTNSTEFSGLDAGAYTLTVRAVDPSLNVDASPAVYTWTVVGPPLTTILAGPPVLPATALTSTAIFSFTADQAGVTFQCALDGFAPAGCTSPVTYAGLANGAHTFSVAATNGVGLTETPAVSYEWTVDVAVTTNTPTGSNVSVALPLPAGAVTVTFSTVTTAGSTTVTALSSPPALPAGFLTAGAQYYDLSTTATYDPPVTVCLDYTPGALAEPVRLLHHEGGNWVDITTTSDPLNGLVCGETTSLSPFALATAVVPVALDTVISSGPLTETVSTTANFTFTSTDPVATFECALDNGGASWGSCAAGSSFTNLAVGLHELLVRAKNGAGEVDATPASYTWTVLPLPDTFIASGPADPTESITATFTFTSTDPAATFECALEEATVFVACVSGITYTGLVFGEHDFFVRAKNANGVDPTPSDYAWQIGEIPPPVTITAAPTEVSGGTTESRDATFVFTATEPGSFNYECSLDSGVFAACISPKSYNSLPLGAHTFQVRVLSPTAIVEPPITSHPWEVVDLTLPETTITAAPASVVSSSGTASIGFSSSEPGATFECSLNDAAFAACTSPQVYSGQAAGVYTFTVRAVDGSGNVDPTPASATWTVVGPPETTIDSSPTGLIITTTVSFTFSSDDPTATFECALDGGPYAACSTPHTVTGLADGPHTLLVRARNAVNIADATPDQATWNIDLLPETTILSGPAGGSGGTTISTVATFVFAASEANVVFQCALDGAAFAECFTPHSLSGLAVGVHQLLVRTLDSTSNLDPTPALYTWTVLNTAPGANVTVSIPASGAALTTTVTFANVTVAGNTTVTATTSVPPLPAGYLQLGSSFYDINTTAGFTGSATVCLNYNPADFVNPAALQLFHYEGGVWTDVTVSNDPVNGVLCGSVTSFSPFGMAVPNDTTAPETTIDSGPTATTAATSATFTFSANESGATFECRLDNETFATCSSPVTRNELSVAAHTFQVRATDAANNSDTTPASYSWTVTPPPDTTAPETTIDSSPAANTIETSASFTFSANETGATFACALNGAAFATCISPATYPGLGVGNHTFQVQATDAAGNTDATPASHAWTITPPPDTTAPETTIDSSPAATTAETSATFTFSANEAGATFECRLDNEVFATCSSPVTLSGLSVAAHTFQVRATDAANNSDATPASYSWTVTPPPDTTAPETTINSGPAANTVETSATFNFSSNEAGATFACALNGAAFAPCTSPATYPGLAVGNHTFQVQATDAAGNSDATPASHAWMIITPDTTAPETILDSVPPANTQLTVADFTFSANETGVTFGCSLDGGAFAPCTSPHQRTGLAVGAHTFAVRATDAAGNVDLNPATFAWTIHAPVTCVVETEVYGAAADAWLEQNSPSSNKGADSILKLKSQGPTDNFRALVQFNLPGTLPNGCVIMSATLRLYSPLWTEGRTLEAQRLNSSWSENSVTWGNQPATVGAPATTTSAQGYREWDVTTQVQEIFTAGANYGFLVRDAAENGGGSEQQFHSREKGETMPALVVRYTPSTVTDTTAPATSLDTWPASSTYSTTAAFTFSSNEAGVNFECRLDGGAYGECISPKQYTGLNVGTHTFAVRAVDPVGNYDATPSTYNWAVIADTTPPVVTINGGPAALTSATTANFTFAANEAGATFACALNGAAFALCTSPTSYSGLAVSSHTFQVQASDSSGNTSTPIGYNWTVETPPDTTAPVVTISAGPSATTAETSASFSFTADESGVTFECSLDGGALASCTSPATANTLALGTHSFAVQATDGAGNIGAPATHSWTVTEPPDTMRPDTTITDMPTNPNESNAASFSFTGSDNRSATTALTFECTLDSGTAVSCTAPMAYNNLTDGAHTFTVVAIDEAGNRDAEAASYTWTVALPPAPPTPPETTIDSSPTASTTATDASFSFSSNEVGVTFECSWDNGGFAACTTPATQSGLALGEHSFSVRAVSSANGSDPSPASQTWTIVEPPDTTAPETTVTSQPAQPTSDTAASFSFTGVDNKTAATALSFQCRLDSSAFTACTSPASYNDLSVGAHTFEVRAIDAASNLDPTPATVTWTINAPPDTTAPETTVSAGPAASTTDTAASFTFAANETGASFQCALDGGAYAACTAPKAYSGLSVGNHTFTVRATDAAGNVDATPASYAWTITAPAVACTAASVTLNASADAWIDQNSASNNFGADSILKVQAKTSNNFRALVRFALPATVPTGCVVRTATLRLYSASWQTGRTLQALRVAANWAENAVSWNNQPATIGAAATTNSGSGWRQWNVTAQVQAMFDLNAKHGFLLRDATESGGGSEQQFHGREKNDRIPQLVITYATPAARSASTTDPNVETWVDSGETGFDGSELISAIYLPLIQFSNVDAQPVADDVSTQQPSEKADPAAVNDPVNDSVDAGSMNKVYLPLMSSVSSRPQSSGTAERKHETTAEGEVTNRLYLPIQVR